MIEDERVTDAACGITKVTDRHEFICILKPHDTEHQRSRQRSRNGYVPKSERHYMVNRWPNREAS